MTVTSVVMSKNDTDGEMLLRLEATNGRNRAACGHWQCCDYA